MKDKKLDCLAEQLYSKINDNNDFFTTKMVIVPSNKIASYLKSYFLKNNRDKVLMNVLFMTFNKALERLFNLDYEIASTNQIRDILIKYLNDPKNHCQKGSKKHNQNNILYDYLNDRNAGDYYIKLFNIANELTDLFNKKEEDHSMKNEKDYENEYKYLRKSLKGQSLSTLRMLVDDAIISKDKIEEDYDVYLFGFIEYSKLETEIIKELNIKDEYILDSTISKEKVSKLSIIKAPSKLREIEYLHCEVCKLLDKGIRYPDILVVGPNMSEYENTISRVFNQDGKEFPNVLYYVNAAVAKNNNIYNALLTIKEIVNKGFFSRLDFDNIITNNAIKYVKKITDEDINNYRASISDMNSYYKEDWEYAKKRLLISKISDINSDNNIVEINDDYLPYSRIGLDDDAIVRFVKIIDDLNDLIKLFNDSNNNTDKDFLEKFNKALDTFLSIKDENDEETNGYYKKVDKVNKYWLENEIYDVPKRTYLESLIDVSKRNITKSGDLYLSGISFTDFDKDFALSAKCIFFINASSDNLPIKKTKNALNKNEVISYDKEKKAFEALYNNCDHLYVSYVSKDLKTDEDFFLSNFVKELTDPLIDEIIQKSDKSVFEEKYLDNISIDEDGSIGEIFTKRGKKNRDFRKVLLGGISNAGNTPSNSIDITKQNIQTKVTTSELGNFLVEPLQSKASRLFGSNDDTMEKVAEEYPPFELNALNESIVFKEICILLFNSNKSEEDARREITKAFDLRKQIPFITKEIENYILDELFDDYHELKEYVSHFGNSIMCSEPMDLDITYNGSSQFLSNKVPFQWSLSNNTPFIKVENDKTIYYFPIKLEERQNSKDLLTMLVIALMDFALNEYSEKEVILCPDYLLLKHSLVINGLNKDSAIERLNLIFESFVDYGNNYLFSYDYLNAGEYNKIKGNYYELVNDVKKKWKYFDDKNLFDLLHDLGYSDNNYKEQIDSEGNVSGEIANNRMKQQELMDKLLGKAVGDADGTK